MTLLTRIAKKVARRFRSKGSMRAMMRRPNRNRQPITALDLWRQVYRFRETPAERAGTKRRIARERKARRRTA
jgi:hypothetical protein